jgi:hypothetical protein
MTSKQKPANRGDSQAVDQTTSNHKPTSLGSRLKATIVTLALRGLLPYAVASWLIRRKGLPHV